MLKLPSIFQNISNKKQKGFSLIETLVSILIGTILLISFYSIINFTVFTLELGEVDDNINLNGRYIVDYIKKEVKLAEMIIPIDNFIIENQDYENNIGFVIVKPSSQSTYRYNYSTYYIKADRIYRLAFNTSMENLRRISGWGVNTIGGEVKDFNKTSLDPNNKIVKISIKMINNSLHEMEIYINAPIYN